MLETVQDTIQDSLMNKKLKEQHLFKKSFVTIYNTFQNFGVSIFFPFLKEIIKYFSKDLLNWCKVIVKTYIVRKDFYFEQMLFFLTFFINY